MSRYLPRDIAMDENPTSSSCGSHELVVFILRASGGQRHRHGLEFKFWCWDFKLRSFESKITAANGGIEPVWSDLACAFWFALPIATTGCSSRLGYEDA